MISIGCQIARLHNMSGRCRLRFATVNPTRPVAMAYVRGGILTKTRENGIRKIFELCRAPAGDDLHGLRPDKDLACYAQISIAMAYPYYGEENFSF